MAGIETKSQLWGREKERSKITTLNVHFPEIDNYVEGQFPDILLWGTSMMERFKKHSNPHFNNRPGINSFDKIIQPYLDMHNFHLANFGCGGDKIANIIYRCLDLKLLEKLKEKGVSPKLNVIMAGANDIETGRIDKMSDEFDFLVSSIKEAFPDSRIAVIGIFPRKSDKKMMTPNKLANYHHQYNQNVQDIAKKYNCNYYYFGDKISLEKHLVDMVHLNYHGYQIFANGLVKLFENELK